jgi:hypothetical protein
MSEEIKKEVQDTELNPNELKQVSGGWTDPFEREERFVFSKEELEKMEKGICPICNKRIESGTDFMKVWEHAKNCKG